MKKLQQNSVNLIKIQEYNRWQENIAKEAEEQITKLIEDNRSRTITENNQRKQVECLKLLLEENDNMIKQHQEIESHLALESMKITLDQQFKTKACISIELLFNIKI